MRVLSALILASTLVACTGAPSSTPDGDPTHGSKDAKMVKAKAPPKGKTPLPAGGDTCKGVRPQKVDLAQLTPTAIPEGAHPGLTDPSKANAEAPETFKVKFETTKGDFVIEAHRDWSPAGVDRFYNLVQIGWFNEVKFFRNIDGFMVQFGISPYPEANEAWFDATIPDEPVKKGNERGMVTFAKCGAPDCRKTQLFINHKNNAGLDRQGFAAIGQIVEGQDVVDSLYDCYGEGMPRGMGPEQGAFNKFGNAYVDAGWPNLDGIKSATLVE